MDPYCSLIAVIRNIMNLVWTSFVHLHPIVCTTSSLRQKIYKIKFVRLALSLVGRKDKSQDRSATQVPLTAWYKDTCKLNITSWLHVSSIVSSQHRILSQPLYGTRDIKSNQRSSSSACSYKKTAWEIQQLCTFSFFFNLFILKRFFRDEPRYVFICYKPSRASQLYQI